MSDTYLAEVEPQTVTAAGAMEIGNFTASLAESPKGTQITTWRVPTSTMVSPIVELFGIPFRIRYGEKHVFMESPRWPSLQTFGQSAEEAIKDMMHLLKDAVEEFVLAPDEELADDAIEFKQYLIKKMIP